MTINGVYLKYELISSFIRAYVAEKHLASAAVTPIDRHKVHIEVIYGMAGDDFTIDVSRIIKKDVVSMLDWLADKIDTRLR